MRGRGAGLGWMLNDPAMRERLGVTAEQAAKIQSQESAFAQNRIRTQADLQAKRMELDRLMRAENPDRALVDKKMRELSDSRLAAEKSQFDHQLTMRNALTPEQKQKLEAWRKEMRQSRMQRGLGGFRRGPRGPMPPAAPAPPQPPAAPAPPSHPDGL
jgi:Spy/CpxP family protein refolding chaperone